MIEIIIFAYYPSFTWTLNPYLPANFLRSCFNKVMTILIANKMLIR